MSLVDRGAGVLWEGEGRYDRTWHNHLELSIDKDSRVEVLAGAMGLNTLTTAELKRSSTAAGETSGLAPKDEL